MGAEEEEGPRKQSQHSHCSALEKKKISLPGEKRKFSAHNSLRRSNSCLSSSSSTSMGTSLRDQLGEEDPAAYLTPTQRKNQEIKRLRLELAKAKSQLISRDKEIVTLKKQVEALKESQKQSSLGESCQADSASESLADSGNCEEIDGEARWGTGEPKREEEDVPELNNIDFELMESTLREEEEYRQKLEDDNEELQVNVRDLKEEVQRLKEIHIEEVARLKKSQDNNICVAKKEIHQKVEELIIELAESSMRCARQQDTIEQRQLKIDELLKEINNNKDDISKLQQIISETKEDQRTDYCKSEEYLKPISYVETISSHCQVEPCKSVAITQTDDEHIQNASHPLETNVELKTMSEAICDNKIHFTYQFLRRSIYYYITDKDNRAYHLKSIQRLLEFSDAELSTIHHTQQKPIVPIKRY